MSLSTIALIKAIILPPTINFLSIGIGLFFAKKNKFYSRTFIYLGFISLILFCIPAFSNLLLKSVEKFSALDVPIAIGEQQAIVVLSGGVYPHAKEYSKAIGGRATLQRNEYAAFLHRQTSLPILVSGGYVDLEHTSEAAVMADTLKESFGIDVTWQEDKSVNTAENAIYSVELLKNHNIDSIYLVTHAWHMLRAVRMFERQGIKVTPAPTIFVPETSRINWLSLVPTAGALLETRTALHEYIGILWYELRY